MTGVQTCALPISMTKASSLCTSRTGHFLKRALAVCATLALVCMAGCTKTGTEPDTSPRVFASPDAAAQALYEAAKAGDAQAILAIFGPTAKDLLMSGNPSQDRQAFKSYTDAYDQMHRWGELEGGDRVLIVGVKNYPFLGLNGSSKHLILEHGLGSSSPESLWVEY